MCPAPNERARSRKLACRAQKYRRSARGSSTTVSVAAASTTALLPSTPCHHRWNDDTPLRGSTIGGRSGKNVRQSLPHTLMGQSRSLLGTPPLPSTTLRNPPPEA